MACSLDSFVLLTLDDVKSYLGVSADDLKADAFSIYHDKSNSVTAATVGLSSNTLTLIITGGAWDGTTTFDLTAADYDTLAELTAAITALAKGWVVTQSGRDDVASADLADMEALTNAYGSDNTLTLTYVNNCLLIELANIATDVFETLADRQFAQRTRTEWHTPKQDGTVQVRDYPINWIDYVATGAQYAIKIRCTSSTAVPEFKYGRFKVAIGTVRVYAKITGGYATIPDDIKLVALAIVKMIWDGRKTSAGMKSERLGDYKYEKFAAIAAVQADKDLAKAVAWYRNEMY